MVVWQGCPIVFSASEIWASCYQLCPTRPACPGFIGRSAVWQLPLGGGAPRCGTAREAWAGGGPAPRAGGGSGLVCVCACGSIATHPQRRGKICTPSLENIRTSMWSVPFLQALSNNAERSKVESGLWLRSQPLYFPSVQPWTTYFTSPASGTSFVKSG